jgi:hypothetical protein
MSGKSPRCGRANRAGQGTENSPPIFAACSADVSHPKSPQLFEILLKNNRETAKQRAVTASMNGLSPFAGRAAPHGSNSLARIAAGVRQAKNLALDIM